ncbi:unnamed protein product [Protopolystoma xenopodis]|uniref:Uncharacterized protein n=1 Tax=Protopolystoma xenopodis TaxID=117903 RepID=A0A3S4ZDU3_9PLAT|nr:unnamed protein product [Protopolystoma xenopodis]
MVCRLPFPVRCVQGRPAPLAVPIETRRSRVAGQRTQQCPYYGQPFDPSPGYLFPPASLLHTVSREGILPARRVGRCAHFELPIRPVGAGLLPLAYSPPLKPATFQDARIRSWVYPVCQCPQTS